MPPNARRARVLSAAAATTKRRGAAHGRGRRRDRGQTLVEFSLVFPVFILLFFGMIEFGFLFNAQLSLNFATRDASLIAAEAGDNLDADCAILQQVDKDLSPPTDGNRITTVRIFRADNLGTPISGVEQVYTRGGTTSCGSVTVPYSLVTANYDPNDRCNVLNGAGCSGGRTGVDIIGVRIDYQYTFVTPMPYLIGGSGSGQNITGSNAMRMEPIL